MAFFKKEIVRGRAQRPAPTFLKIAIILEFLHRFVGAALRGRPINLSSLELLPGLSVRQIYDEEKKCQASVRPECY